MAPSMAGGVPACRRVPPIALAVIAPGASAPTATPATITSPAAVPLMPISGLAAVEASQSLFTAAWRPALGSLSRVVAQPGKAPNMPRFVGTGACVAPTAERVPGPGEREHQQRPAGSSLPARPILARDISTQWESPHPAGGDRGPHREPSPLTPCLTAPGPGFR